MELKRILDELSKKVWDVTYNDSRQYIHIQTNFLNHINDSIDCYIYKEGDTYYLTDDGWFMAEIDMAGIEYRQLEGRLDWLRNRHFGVIRDTQNNEFRMPINSEGDIELTVTHYIQFLVEGYGLLAQEIIKIRG